MVPAWFLELKQLADDSAQLLIMLFGMETAENNAIGWKQYNSF